MSLRVSCHIRTNLTYNCFSRYDLMVSDALKQVVARLNPNINQNPKLKSKEPNDQSLV